MEAETYNAEDRVRYKLVRWKLGKSGGIDMRPGRLAPRVLKRLRELGSVVAPRVVAACSGILWNRWCTERRFSREGFCTLGCEHPAADSIEHYAHCKAVHDVAKKTLTLHCEGPLAIEWFMLARKELADEGTLVCMAVLIYATYTTTNRMRKLGIKDMGTAVEALEQKIREAIRSHRHSEKVINSRWAEVENRPKRRRRTERLG